MVLLLKNINLLITIKMLTDGNYMDRPNDPDEMTNVYDDPKYFDMKKLKITYHGQKIEIEYSLRHGKKGTVLYLHGLGCSKSDFLGATEIESLQVYSLIALDFPGHGDTSYQEKLGMDDLVEIVNLFNEKLNLNDLILIGHSMGGLVALLLAEKYAKKVKIFINVEGNLKAEDCFFSSQVTEADFGIFEREIFQNFKHKLSSSENIGFKKYAKLLEQHKPTKAFYDYCPSLVRYSNNGQLIDKFLSLKIPKLFVHGSENSGLSYIPELNKNGCEVAEISDSNHFPHHDNPIEFYDVISNFLNKA